MNNPAISIIVPVHDVEKYLRGCLDSIITQTFVNWECILVDDGSIDPSGTICDEYAAKDQRIRIFHKENGGVSSARNVGLQHARGEWFYFPDSDDMLKPNALDIMVNMISVDIDYVMCGYEIYDENDQCVYAIGESKRKYISRHDALMEMFNPSDYRYQGYLWNKLFRASIISKYALSFDENIRYNEDRLFNVVYLSKIEGNVVYATTPVYRYMKRLTSAMASLSVRFTEDFLTDLDAFVKMCIPLKNISVSDDIWDAHADKMCYSVRLYYDMCRRFRKLSPSRVWNVEKRFLCGVGIKRYVRIRLLKNKFMDSLLK